VTIYQGSRYENAVVQKVLAPDGSTRSTIMPVVRPVGSAVILHTVIDGDRIDILANNYLGDPTQWWQIADANPDWLWWDSLPAGLIIRIPYDSTAA
jgi:hypothetical protein